MLSEVARLLMGITLLAFHRPLADFIVELEHSLAAMFRVGGLNLPGPPKRSIMHTIYFCLGIFVCVFSMAKIYAGLPQ